MVYRTLHCHHYCKLSLSESCTGVEEEDFKRQIHFPFMTRATPSVRTLALGVLERRGS